MEGGTATVEQRLQGLRKLALNGYPVGIVIAPIMAILPSTVPITGERTLRPHLTPATDCLANWQHHYTKLFDQIEQALNIDCDLTFELITHRFTPKSKEVLQTWYPNSKLDLDENNRSQKRNKFGGVKYVYERDTMSELKELIQTEIEARFSNAKILYWT